MSLFKIIFSLMHVQILLHYQILMALLMQDTSLIMYLTGPS
jgi:hypothetical protein